MVIKKYNEKPTPLKKRSPTGISPKKPTLKASKKTLTKLIILIIIQKIRYRKRVDRIWLKIEKESKKNTLEESIKIKTKKRQRIEKKIGWETWDNVR